MIIQGIQLRQFRNISQAQLQFHSGLNIFRGQNGQGKTNLLEAIYLTQQGRSFRTHLVENLVQKQKNSGFFIKASIKKADFEYSVGVTYQGKSKKVEVNGKKSSFLSLRKNFGAVLFSPESLSIIKESASHRRDLVDELCFALFPDFSKTYMDFKRLYKQKSQLLKKIKNEEIGTSGNEGLLDSLTQQFFQMGTKLTQFRLLAIQEIEPLLLQEFLEIMDDHYDNISIKYLISGVPFSRESSAEILNAMYKRWESLKPMEMATGQCLVGPHKHEIDFIFDGQQARFFCSQGQQRAIILAFKMAQIRLHYRAHNVFPILLLDDVLSELDQGKQMRFVKYLQSTGAQIFLTTTDATRVPENVEKSVFEVEQGRFLGRPLEVIGGPSV